MSLTFLTPLGALAALGALLPLLAFALNDRRAARVRRTLRLDGPTPRSRAVTAAALSLTPGLLAVALAQPVLRSSSVRHVRTDAELFLVFDTSTSMDAAPPPGHPTRLERALRDAKRINLAFQDLRTGVATMTDRVLPDLFPTADEQVLIATLDQSVGLNRPPPKGLDPVATTFAALDTFAGTNFFDPGVKHRLVVLFTDGETAPYQQGELRTALLQRPRTSFVIVRYWRANERIHTARGIDPNYRPSPASAEETSRLASIVNGRAFDENRLGSAISAARRAIGKGPVESLGLGLNVIALSRWFALAALVPLAFVLWRRNVV